jgi:hypothetical protein
MRLFTPALVGLLLLAPAAAHADTPIYKVSAYGVQRITTTDTATATGKCFDERGSQKTETVVRFKTPRGTRGRFHVYSTAALLLAVGNREVKLSGTIERKVTGSMEHAGCNDLNPDGSQKWEPVEIPPDASCSRSFDDYTASIRYAGRLIGFNAQQPELASLTCPGVDIASVRQTTPLRKVVESAKTPIRIQTSSEDTTKAPDGSSSSTTKRLTTVYIQFKKIG